MQQKQINKHCPRKWAFALTVEDEMKKKHSYSGGKLRLLVFTIILLIVSIISFYASTKCNNKCNDYTEEAIDGTKDNVESQSYEFREEETSIEVINLVHTEVLYGQPQEEEVHYIKFQDRMSMDWDSGEAYLLAKIAMAEAEGESTEGKALVMLVVLNRVLDDNFPDTIGEVIFQHNGDDYQFSPVGSGRIYENEPNEDCWAALDLIYSGWDESQGALYFESSKCDNTWHSRNLEFLFEEGGHKFYK